MFRSKSLGRCVLAQIVARYLSFGSGRQNGVAAHDCDKVRVVIFDEILAFALGLQASHQIHLFVHAVFKCG